VGNPICERSFDYLTPLLALTGGHPLRKGNTQSIHFPGLLRLRAKHFGVIVGS
jgi:hypothetical protein